jgi:predicted alpha-1,2-mannosidase
MIACQNCYLNRGQLSDGNPMGVAGRLTSPKRIPKVPTCDGTGTIFRNDGLAVPIDLRIYLTMVSNPQEGKSNEGMFMKAWEVNRRNFLRMSGAAMLSPGFATTTDAESVRAELSAGAARFPEEENGDLLRYVNPLQGTDSTPEFSRGNTLPIVAMPFGMAHWTLQSSTRSGWFFNPHDCRLQGVRCTHQLSPWLGDYGYATFLPFQGEPSPDPERRASSYRPAELALSPHSMRFRLMRYRCWVELAPTERGALMEVEFEDPGACGLYIDLPGDDAEAHADLSAGIVRAITHDNRGGVQKNFAAYYFIRFDEPIAACEVQALNGRRVAVVRLRANGASKANIRIGTSFISSEQAERNLQREIGDRSLEELKKAAGEVWQQTLGRVHIHGGSEVQMRTFYSCLWRTQLFPRMWHEVDAGGRTVHRSPYTGEVEPGVLYADHGYWDDYHAWYPMMALLYPERLGDILNSWINAYKEGGWFPQFPCPGYRGAMTGSLIDSVFGEGVAKSVPGFDVHVAYEGLKKHATQPGDPAKGYGRVGIQEYLQLGYVPADKFGGAVAQTLDLAYGDFCIAQVARAAGAEQDAAMFEKRSGNWKHVFDAKKMFMRGKLADGSWLEPFDPYTWGGAYVEGGAWQYRFNVWHDAESLIASYGGREPFVQCLEEMLQGPPRFHVGSYGAEIHEMSEMAAADFGQYAHSNQPVHNVLYLFTVAGRRDKTQHWVHRVLNELYSPDNFAGDEDTGATSAWYILSALGLFALCPGKPEWALGAPLFPGASINFPDGRKIRIDAQRKSEDAFYDGVMINGSQHEGAAIAHSLLMKDAHIVFSST